jgi:hypothetical protein
MKTCWAACLGGCSDTISREHLVSRNLFVDEELTVEGFPWCKGQSVKVGLGALTSKILCKKHNSDLSDVDAIGGKTFAAFRETRRLANIREKKQKYRWTIVRTTIDGLGFERWCLKTLINLSYDRDKPIGRDSLHPGKPSDRLVRIAYGLEPFVGKGGLYFITRVGMNIQSEDRVGFRPLSKQLGNIEGGFFSIRGLSFLLYLEPEGPPNLTGVQVFGENLGNAMVNHRMREIKVMNGKYLSELQTFEW